MADILNKCPVCGSELEYYSLYQFSKVYRILKSGRLSSRQKRKEDDGPMECGFISCVKCDFHTNCNLELEEESKYKIYQCGETYMIENARRKI